MGFSCNMQKASCWRGLSSSSQRSSSMAAALGRAGGGDGACARRCLGLEGLGDRAGLGQGWWRGELGALCPLLVRGASAARALAVTAATATTKRAGHASRFRRGERLRCAQRIRDLSVEEHVGRGAAGLSPAAHRGPKLGRFRERHVFVVECVPNRPALLVAQ